MSTSVQLPIPERSKKIMRKAEDIVRARGWTPDAPVFVGKRWKLAYTDQWGIKHAHTLSQLLDLGSSSHVFYIGEKLCRLILRDLFPDNRWEYNRRFDWLKEVSDGPALELDIFCPDLNIACEHNGKHHRSSQRVMARDVHKLTVCARMNVRLLVVDQPNYITVPAYCNLIGAALTKMKVPYNAERLKTIADLDGASDTVNSFIKHCYSEFTKEVIGYISRQGGELLKVNDSPWRPGGSLSKRSRLQIKPACGHALIRAEAGELFIKGSWCKRCSLTKHKLRKFKDRIELLKQRRLTQFRNIGVDLDKVVRTPSGLSNIVCEFCGNSLQNLTWSSLENLCSGWCSGCAQLVKRSARLAKVRWQLLEENNGALRCRCLNLECSAEFTASTRNLYDFDQSVACCPVGRTGSDDHDGRVNLTFPRLVSLLRSIHPRGQVLDRSIRKNGMYECHCGVVGHPTFTVSQTSLIKAIARLVISELIDAQLLVKTAPKDTVPALAALVSDEGLQLDPARNYSNNALKFLRTHETPALRSFWENSRSQLLLPAVEYKHLHRNSYRCSACSPTGVRKNKKDSDYLARVEQVDQLFKINRTQHRPTAVELPGGNIIKIHCGNALHDSFERNLSSWNQIKVRYCKPCRDLVKASAREKLEGL